MSKLYFKIGSDWEEVVRLRNEIAKLKQELMSMDGTQSPAVFKALNTQLAASNQKLDELVTNAAKAGAEMETGFKRKIFDASQVVNGLSEKITFQRGTIQQLKNELAGLKDKYKEALKADGDVTGLGIKVKSVNARLSEQKSVLFDLTQQQAGARLNVKKLRDEYELYKENGEEVNETNESLAMSWGKVIGAIGGAAALKSFVSEMMNVRGEFQQLEIAFGTMLKSKEKADKLMAELVDIAAKTPFDLQGVASSAKQMLAYGSSAESVGKELVMLGNVAAGVGAQLGDIAYLYGTLRTQGRAYAVDIRQFAGRGIPIYEELAKVMGVTKDEVSDLVSQGKVGFKEVEQAFQNMTKEGGMYFNLMQEQSKSLTGQISNLGDAWDSMLNEMGKKGEGVFYTAISAAKSLVENYEKVGMVIEGLIITYGAYKTALMANIALEKIQAANRLASIKGVTAMKMVTDLMTGSVAKLNKVLMLNPYALVGAAALASSVYMLKWADSQDKCTEATERFNKAEEASKQAREERNRNVNEYIKIASDEKRTTDERKIAIESLKDAYKKLLPQYDKESFLLKNIAEYRKKINEEELRNERIGTKKKITMLDRDIAKYKNGLKEANRQGAGQATQAIMNTLNNLKKERELYDKKLQQLESESSAGTGKKEEKVKNKTYWEKQKKDAQAALDAIDSVKRKKMNTGDFKGIDSEDKNIFQESKKKIKEAEKHLKAYEKEEKIQKEAGKKLKQQEKISEQLLSLRRKNQQDEISLMEDGTEKKLAQIDLDYQKELDAIRKQEQEWSKANGGKLTKEQSVQISLSYSQAENKRDKSISDVNKEELEAMNRYLKEYGTFQQKKEAITKEYNDKMTKATTEGGKKLLQKEMEEALSSVDMDKLKQEINWELIFGDLNKVSKKSLEQVKQQLKTFKNSDEYKNMAVDQKKVIDEALNNIQSTIIDKGGLLGDLPEQLDALRIAQDELKQAQDEYNKSLKSGTDAEKEAALKKKNKAEKNVQNAETNVTRSADKTQKSLITLTDTVTQLGSSSEMSLSQIGNLAAGLVDTFSEAGSKIGGIVGTVFSLLDGIEKQGFDGFVKNVFSSVFGAGASMWNTLTFGGFNKLFGIGGNAKEVQDSINRLTDRNETLQTSIESLTDEIKASKGTKSVAAYRSAYEYQKEQNSNYLNIAREQAGYHNSHKSWQYYMRWSAEDLKWIQQNINKNFTGTSSLWELTPEEMEKLRSNVDIWTKMQNAGKGGYGERVTDKLDDYIEQAGKLEELTDNLYEGLTGMSFDSMYDSFVSSLMDMEKSAEDVADDISKYFMQAMLSNAIGEQFSDKLRAWYDKFGEAMKDDGTLDNNERKELMDEYMGYVDEAMKLRDELAAATGYDKISQESTSQSASSKGFQAMSQDTGEELNGRFTALQIAGEEIKNQNIIQSQSLNLLTVKADALLSINTETRNIADDTRDLIAQSYLELVQISENTGAIVKPIIQIQKDMAEVKNNTSKL